MSIADIRKQYSKSVLNEDALATTPLEQFSKWFDEALRADVMEPNAMVLATVGADGCPAARIVLLKGLDERGLVFFTNYESRKGRELTAHPLASLLFFWPELERQVRLEGSIEKIAASESDVYYNGRPLGSRIGAWVSPQSQPITRKELEQRLKDFTESLGDNPSRPPHWGGYRLRPQRVEFWQGRPSRLHDRLRYQLENDHWTIERLAP